MFKLESYVTPLILSYVNKYIKNLKPEDSQVSLWGGDAVFNNLDLRIDVLEQELQLPFIFVSGHIHELRIHVPWTKLGSEPIIITINTIECILKLKNSVNTNKDPAEASSTNSSGSHRSKNEIKKKTRRQEIEDTPSSYVQSLINRIINNITIICNNLILKYVEDDIVLSLNVKSVQVFSVNENWENAFIDLTLPELVLRKLINLYDLTVCLDRRNASGKIETYQDPLLYRCSLEGRLYLGFDSLNAKIPSVTHLDILCDKLEFSLTDQQLPMFVRLIQLCIALYFGEIDGINSKYETQDHVKEDNLLVTSESLEPYNQSWSSWAWSMIPEIIPVWEEDEDSDNNVGPKLPPSVLHLGLYVKNASFVFKLIEILDPGVSHSVQKVAFHPFACLYQEGIFLNFVARYPDCVNFQMGMQTVRLARLGDCICKTPDTNYTSLGELDPAFFIIGDNEKIVDSHLNGSLFSSTAPENIGQRREYIYTWDDHMGEHGETQMLKYSSAFAMDFFYLLELPEDLADKSSTMSLNDLENSNFKERIMLRMIFCKPELNVTGALVHRYQKFLHCMQNREYEPYNKLKDDSFTDDAITPNPDDVAALEEFVPNRSCLIILRQPVIRIFPADHPKYDVTKETFTVKKVKRKYSRNQSKMSSSLLPAIILSANRFEMSYNVPMYPKRMMQIVTKLHPPSENLLHQSHSHMTFKVFGFEVNFQASLHQKEKVTIFPPSTGSYYIKELVLSELWKKPFQPKVEHFIEVSRISLRFTRPQLLLVVNIYKSWYYSTPDHWLFSHTSLIEDSLKGNAGSSVMEVCLTGLEWKHSESDILTSYIGWIGALRVTLQSLSNDTINTITLLHGPEEKESIHSTGFFKDPLDKQCVDFLLAQDRVFNLVLQIPKNNIAYTTAPAVFLVNVKGVVASIDPSLYNWLLYFPRILREKNFKAQTTATIYEESLEMCSKESADSSAPVTILSGSQTQSLQQPPKSSVDKNNSFLLAHYMDYCLNLYNLLRKLSVQVLFESSTVFLPSKSMTNDCFSSSIVKSFKKAFAEGTLSDTIVINLPQIRLRNEVQKNNLFLEIHDVPILNLDGWNTGEDLFPWNLNLCRASIYSLQDSKDVQPCLQPVIASATIAFTTKCTPPTSDKISQLGLCIHADMEPLRLSFSDKQVSIMTSSIQGLLNSVSKIIIRNGADILDPVLKPSFSPETCLNPKASILSTSQMEIVDVATLPTVTDNNEDMKNDKRNFFQNTLTEEVRMSIWLQWTLPKFTLDLYTSDEKKGVWLSLDVDEMIVSVDIQDVYSKVKLKIASLNCNHYMKDETTENWKPGPFEGIIFCSNDKFSREVHIPTSKQDIKEGTFGLYENIQTRQADALQYSFFTLTYTRAQCKNVQKRWIDLLQETCDENPELNLLNFPVKQQRYISEIDLKIRPFDFVMWSPILVKAMNILMPFSTIDFPKKIITSPKILSSIEPIKPSMMCIDTMKINNNTLPLLYVNASTIRIFCPDCPDTSDNHNKADVNISETEDTKYNENISSYFPPFLKNKMNMSVFQIASVVLSPQVENPLSRIVLRSDIYSLAQQARITNIPGSVVEDRQYQVDVTGICLTTGSWEEFISCSNSETISNVSSKLHTMGENPALEWNNKVLSASEKEEENLIFLPIISPFDIRILFAPSVVYECLSGSENLHQETIICGHSFEINVTTELEFYFRINQIVLLSNIYLSNFSCLFVPFDSIASHSENDVKHDGKDISLTKQICDNRPDSGIESDISTLKTIGDLPSLVKILPEESAINFQEKSSVNSTSILSPKHADFIPYEVLLTAGHISIIFYDVRYENNQNKAKNVKTKQVPFKRRKTKHRLSEPSVTSSSGQGKHLVKKRSDLDWKERKLSLGNDGYEGSEEESIDDGIDSDFQKNTIRNHIPKIIPLLYLKFVQPHTFLKCEEFKQKLEISCFDVNIRSSTENNCVQATEAKLFPLPEDYTVSWLETKPGNADSKTGIPPAFSTFTVENFFHLPAVSKLRIERPLKTALSITKIKELNEMLQLFLSITSTPLSDNIIDSEKKEQSTAFNINMWRNMGRNINKINISFVQLVFIIETIPHKENSHLICNISNTNGSVEFKVGNSDEISEANFGIRFKDFLIKTSYNQKHCFLLGPSSFKINVITTWEDWNMASPFPYISVNIENESLLLYLGQENLICLKTMISHLQQFLLQGESDDVISSSLEKNKIKSLFSSMKPVTSQSQFWHDDLRIGTFQYIQDADDLGLQPEPYEIVFCREQAGQPACMTWCYPEPRILTKVEIYPVPFRAASDVTTHSSQDVKEEISCVLQFWDPIIHSFITYKNFQLSETQQCVLDLPSISENINHRLIVASKWRVVLDYVEDEDDDEEIVRRSLVSPLALAACMRVDSYFNPELVPFLQLRMNFYMIKITISNHLQQSGKATPLQLQPFVFDDTIPNVQDFLFTTMENFCIKSNIWNNLFRIETNCSIKIDILEYRNLTIIPLVESFALQNQLMISKVDVEHPIIIEMSMICDFIKFKISQITVHTLNSAVHAWNLCNENHCEQILMNHYVICNDTRETIRFGQVGMDENITLPSRQMHAYSWRSHKAKQLLHMCVKGMHWKWCEPFDIDSVGETVLTVEHKGYQATLIIKVKLLNKIQKQVTIQGRLCLMNSLNRCLELKLINVNCNTESNIGNTQQIILNQESISATHIIEPKHLKSIQVRFKNPNSLWSADIEIPRKQKFHHRLVQIAMKTEGQFVNIWCHFLQKKLCLGDQIMINFAPIYIVQTHLPRSLTLNVTSSGSEENYSIEVEGRGKEYQLHCAGNADSSCQLSFQVSPNLEVSKPLLPLSLNMVSQIKKSDSASVDWEEIIQTGISSDVLCWPYDDDEIESHIKKLPPIGIELLKKNHRPQSNISFSEVDQPKIDLEVSLTPKWPHCNTILISVKPWGLIINKCPFTLIIHNSDKDVLFVNTMETFASPKLEGQIKLGIKIGNKIHFSEDLTFIDEDWSFRNNWPRAHDKVPKTGFSQIAVLINEENKKLLSYITVNSKVSRGLTIIQVQPTYNIINKSQCNLKLSACTVWNIDPQVKYFPKYESQLYLKGDAEAKELSVEAILYWEFSNNAKEEIFNLKEHVRYVSLSTCIQGTDFENWSFPCRLESSHHDARYTIAVPKLELDDEKFSPQSLTTLPFVLSSHEFNGAIYLVIDVEQHPQMILYNNCSIPLLYGQQLQNANEEYVVAEEMELVYGLPYVEPLKACHYSFPSISKIFPEISTSYYYPKICFAKFDSSELQSNNSDGENNATLHWSSGLDITTENDLFLNIPGYSDVRTHLEKIGYTMHVFIEPVSRIEISAKEIRSRIRSRNQSYSPFCSAKMHNFSEVEKIIISSSPSSKITTIDASDTAGERSDDENSLCTGFDTDLNNKLSKEKGNKLTKKQSSLLSKKFLGNNTCMYYLNFFAKHISFAMLDALSSCEEFCEVIQLNADDIVCALRPVEETKSKNKRLPANLNQEIWLCIGNAQMDNQLSLLKNYDFPVILLPQEKYTSIADSPIEHALQSVRKNAFFIGELLLENDDNSNKLCVESLLIIVKPFKLYIEDTFLYTLISLLPTFIPDILNTSKCNEFHDISNDIPRHLMNNVVAFHSPIRIQKLLIEPISLMFSLHASLKLFISLDHTPLAFRSFHRSNMITSSYPLGHALTVHYLSGALIRAGWVVGSLDLIGNPGGFIRAVGSGMSDFVKLPYHGLMRGPWAFLSGVAHGSTSLLQQISAGTLVSITNLASSVSRNMEKLSLDEMYNQQNEEIRRHKPDSMARGLTQGLSGFGISLLGAVAGIIDQPLQTMQQAIGHRNFPSQVFTGLIAGVGKGLVGIITKPIGGAAELVSQAGQGILYGTGWSTMLQVRYEAANENRSLFANSHLKYAWKMLPDLPHAEVILALEATQINHSGNYVPSVLLLTSQMLFLVNIEEDMQQQAFLLSEIDCVSASVDPTLIYIIPQIQKPNASSQQVENDNHERIEEFVNKTVKYMMQCQEEIEFQSDSSSQPSPILSTAGISMNFYVNPNLRDTFLALFKIAQSCILGRGFVV